MFIIVIFSVYIKSWKAPKCSLGEFSKVCSATWNQIGLQEKKVNNYFQFEEKLSLNGI